MITNLSQEQARKIVTNVSALIDTALNVLEEAAGSPIDRMAVAILMVGGLCHAEPELMQLICTTAPAEEPVPIDFLLTYVRRVFAPAKT